MAELKIERGCAHCGYNEHPDALQLDHIVPDGKGHARHDTVWRSTLVGVERMVSDPKIQVLCANCHSIKSNAERRAQMPS